MDYRAGGRFEVRIAPADVGKRVSVRRVAENDGTRPVFTDTIGLLTSWSDGVLMITRRDGETVHIAESTLVAGKVVPPAPARRRSRPPRDEPGELREVTARGWPATETEHLGGWLLRASDGFTRRANCVLPLGDPGVPLDEALRRVHNWYTTRGLPPFVQVETGSATAAALAERGWATEGHTQLRTAALAPLVDGPEAERVTLSRELDEGWLTRYHRTGDLASAARGVLTRGSSVWFATVPATGNEPPSAVGRCVVDGRWALFGAVEVDPALRRRGLGTAVMTALAREALAEGADVAVLQVEEENAAALALYDGMGFITRERYHYCRPAPPSDGDGRTPAGE